VSDNRERSFVNRDLIFLSSFESEAVPGTIPQGQNSPRCVRFGLYAEQMTASAFVAPRGSNKNAWLYRARPAVAHEGFVSSFLRLRQGQDMLTVM
jgi:homogentisate 1,2-dioxygenase